MVSFLDYCYKLDKFYRLISNRYTKYILYFFNSLFGFFIGLLSFVSFNHILSGNNDGVMFFIAAIVMMFMVEFLQIIFKNSYNSIFTIDKINIYPLSKFHHLRNLLISNFFSSRLIYFIVLFVTILYFSINHNIIHLLITALTFTIFYSIVSILFTVLDYGYAFLVKLFGKKTNYIVIGFYMGVILIFRLIFNHIKGIDFENFKITLIHILKSILNI